ncbi:MAG: hypothetical protein AB7O57_17510, partial [Hyphomicrobiaceae bacterium]
MVAGQRLVAFDPRAAPANVRVLAALWGAVDGATLEARIDIEHMAAELKCETKKLSAAVRKLADWGYLKIESRHRTWRVRLVPPTADWATSISIARDRLKCDEATLGRHRPVGVIGRARAATRSDLALAERCAHELSTATSAALASFRGQWLRRAIVLSGTSATRCQILCAIEARTTAAGYAVVSMGWLAKIAGCTERAARRALAALECDDVVATTRRAPGGLGGVEALAVVPVFPERLAVLREDLAAAEDVARLAAAGLKRAWPAEERVRAPARRVDSSSTQDGQLEPAGRTLSAPCLYMLRNQSSESPRGEVRRRAPARPRQTNIRLLLEEKMRAEVGDLNVPGLQGWADAWLGDRHVDLTSKAARHAGSTTRRTLAEWVVEDIVAELERLGLLAAAGEPASDAERAAIVAGLRAAAPVVAAGEMAAGVALQAARERAAVDRGRPVAVAGATIFDGPNHDVGGRFATVSLADVAALRIRHGVSVELVEAALGAADAAVGDLASGRWRLPPDQRRAALLAEDSRLLDELEREAIRRADLAPDEVPAPGRLLPALAEALALVEDLGLEVPLAKLSPGEHEAAVEEMTMALETNAGITYRRGQVVAVMGRGRQVLGRDVETIALGRWIEPSLAAHAAELAAAFGGTPADALAALEWHALRRPQAEPLDALPAAARRAAIAAAGPALAPLDWGGASGAAYPSSPPAWIPP